MSALLIADIEVTDAEGYEDYLRQLPEMMAAYDGRYVVRGGTAEVLEGSWRPHRIAVLEFPTMEKLLAFYDSAEYAPVKAIRMNSSDSRIIAVESI